MGQNPTEDEVLNLVIEYDVNGDGTIDFDEFLEMMRKQEEWFRGHVIKPDQFAYAIKKNANHGDCTFWYDQYLFNGIQSIFRFGRRQISTVY